MSYKLKSGINICSNSEYHSDKTFLSSSKLKLMLKDPAKFYSETILGQSTPLKDMHLEEGSAIHTALLEPHLFAEEYAIYPGFIKRGHEWEQFKQDHLGKTILSAPQKSRVDSAIEASKARPELAQFLAGGIPEHTVACTLLDVPVKARADYINIDKGYIFDLKTTRHESHSELFKHTISEYSYQLSAALYCQVMYEQYRKLFDFYFGVYSKADRVWDIYKASSATLTEGHAMVNRALIIYKKCMATGIWSQDSLSKTKAMNPDSDYEIIEI